MITEKDLQEAIAECQGQRNPNANTAIKLAAFLTIQKELFGASTYSYAPPPKTQLETSGEPQEREFVGDYGDSEFLQAVSGRESSETWHIMDELMETLKIVMPKLYDGVMRQIDFL